MRFEKIFHFAKLIYRNLECVWPSCSNHCGNHVIITHHVVSSAQFPAFFSGHVWARGEDTWPACPEATCVYCLSNANKAGCLFFLSAHSWLVILFPRKLMHSEFIIIEMLNSIWHFQFGLFFSFLQETLEDQLPPWICRFSIIDTQSRLTSDVMKCDDGTMAMSVIMRAPGP